MNINQQQKINKIGKTIGSSLVRIGTKMIQSSFSLKPTEVIAHQVRTFLQGYGYKNNVTLSDGKYRLVPFYQWKEIIKIDWTDKKKYLTDFYDCDNFAFLFAARMAEIFELNSAGVAHGHIYNKDTGKWIAGHFWNVIVSNDFKLWFYEPMKDLYERDLPNQRTIIEDWDYYPLSFRFF